MSEVLPEGWQLTTLDAIADWGSGGTPSRKNAEYYGGDIPWIKTGDLGPKVITEASEFITEEAVKNSSAKFFPKGSVAIAMYGATIGKTSIFGLDATTNQACGVGQPMQGGTTTEFLYYLLVNEKDRFIAKGKCGAQPNISQTLIKSHQISIPSLAEQKQIATKLDQLLSQVNTLKNRLDAVPTILKRFRQSVLAAAVSGKLTEEWRGNIEDQFKLSGQQVIHNDVVAKADIIEKHPDLKKKKSSLQCDINTDYIFELPKSWKFTSWGKLSEWITYGFTKPMPKSPKGVKLITAKDVKHFSLNIEGANFTTLAAFESLSDKDRPICGDLLITKDGTIGRPVLIRTEEPFCINQSVAVCWLRSTTMNKDYLEILANSEFTQRFVQEKSQGMAIQHLSIIDFAKCPVPVPSIDEQDEIVRSVHQLFGFADQIEKQVNSAQTRINNMTQSILAKAFRGELTAEWREQNPDLISGENSAEALLKKIKEEREKLAQTRAKKKTAKKKAIA